MIEELEALVSHLYLVGGRAVHVLPPGAVVQLAPRHAPRSRERDAFFALVLPSALRLAKANFYERMAQLAAERYFASDGAVTTSLRGMLESINDDLYAHNQEHPDQQFFAEAICLVLRQRDVYIARTGGGLFLLWQGGAFETFPYDLQDPELANGQPLGYAPEADLKLARFTVQPGDMAALSDAGLTDIPREELAKAAGSGQVQQTVAQLKSYPLVSATALVMRFITPDAPDPVSAPEAAAPVQTRSAATHECPEPAAAVSGSPHEDVAKKPSRPSLMARIRHLWQRGASRRQAITESVPRPSLTEIQTGGRSLIFRLGGRLLHLVQRVLLWLSDGLRRARRLLDKVLPEPEPGKPPSLPTPLAAAAAMLIPVAVVLLVVALALTTRDETAFEQCLSEAQIAAEVARQIEENGSGDPQQAWFGVLEGLNRCASRRPDDPTLMTLREEAQSHLDEYAGVVRCPMTPLRRFEPGADLRGPILQGGVNLYTLDVERSIIYRDTLNETGNALIRDSEIIVQRGDSIGEFVIRNLVDIAWLTEGGVARRSALIGLDSRSGVLVSYSPTFPPATAQALIGTDRWLRPIAIETWQGRLYILDPAANQIWRYQPIGGEYPGAPEEYFVGDDRPDLSDAVDFAIDQTGNVYVLLRDGSMLKFYAGEPSFFQFANLPSGGVGRLGSANAMFLDTGLISPGFYILDAANQVFYETTLAGTFIRGYRAPTGTSFRDLSGLAVDDSAENLYVTARNLLYHIHKCE